MGNQFSYAPEIGAKSRSPNDILVGNEPSTVAELMRFESLRTKTGDPKLGIPTGMFLTIKYGERRRMVSYL